MMSHYKAPNSHRAFAFEQWADRVDARTLMKAQSTMRAMRDLQRVARGGMSAFRVSATASPAFFLLYIQDLGESVRDVIRTDAALAILAQTRRADAVSHDRAIETAEDAMGEFFARRDAQRRIFEETLKLAKAHRNIDVYRRLSAALRRMNAESPEVWRAVFHHAYNAQFERSSDTVQPHTAIE